MHWIQFIFAIRMCNKHDLNVDAFIFVLNLCLWFVSRSSLGLYARCAFFFCFVFWICTFTLFAARQVFCCIEHGCCCVVCNVCTGRTLCCKYTINHTCISMWLTSNALYLCSGSRPLSTCSSDGKGTSYKPEYIKEEHGLRLILVQNIGVLLKEQSGGARARPYTFRY